MKIARHQSGFTLIEMLTVIAIVGILAALVVPALKNVGNGNAAVSASRQLLDDVARARQLAISQHTTVYMVFVPTNFWDINLNPANGFNSMWFSSLTPAQQAAATNLCNEQMTGYTFMADGAIGDQPGQHVWHYLAPWQNLPEGTFIALWKFNQPVQPFQFTDPVDNSKTYSISQFNYTNNFFPFPTEDSTNVVSLPYIAFNYLGQLTTALLTPQPFARDEYTPMARGNVSPAINPATKTFLFNPPQVSETPPGNSTNTYNLIHIDWLTGRARVEQPKIQ